MIHRVSWKAIHHRSVSEIEAAKPPLPKYLPLPKEGVGGVERSTENEEEGRWVGMFRWKKEGRKRRHPSYWRLPMKEVVAWKDWQRKTADSRALETTIVDCPW